MKPRTPPPRGARPRTPGPPAKPRPRLAASPRLAPALRAGFALGACAAASSLAGGLALLFAGGAGFRLADPRLGDPPTLISAAQCLAAWLALSGVAAWLDRREARARIAKEPPSAMESPSAKECGPHAARPRVCWIAAAFGERTRRLADPARPARATPWKRGLAGLALGFGVAAACVALLLAADVSRLGWRLDSPRFSIDTLALAGFVALAGGFEAAWIHRALGGCLREGRRALGLALAVAFGALSRYGGAPVAYLNRGLIAWIAWELYGKGSLAPAAGFRIGWGLCALCLAGSPLTTGAIYEAYAVSDYWLGGGDAGILSGLAMTLLLSLAGFGVRGWGARGLLWRMRGRKGV